MINKAIVSFATREPIEKVPGLFKLITDEGVEFSTFAPFQYPLGESIEIQYEIVPSGKNGQYKQNRLKDRPASKEMGDSFRAKAAQIKPAINITGFDPTGTHGLPANEAELIGLVKLAIEKLTRIEDKVDAVLYNQNPVPF